jgi:hypothetical protein
MDLAVPFVQSVEEFLSVGRITAWLCGMAHLRSKAMEEFFMLRDDLKLQLDSVSGQSEGLENLFKDEWWGVMLPTFIGEVGGFVGYGGSFSTPPLVALVSNQIIATDKKNSAGFFADHLGKVLLNEVPVSSEFISKSARLDDWISIKSRTPGLVPFDDVSSAVLKNSTLVLTRKSSHYLYVYGWSKG